MLLSSAQQAAPLVSAIAMITDRMALLNTILANGGHIDGGDVYLLDPTVNQTFTLKFPGNNAADSATILNAVLSVLQKHLDDSNAALAAL